jgi:hypothetical protein
LDSFDPLEETVAADDIGGRNNHPIWARISAIGCFDPTQRVSIVNGSRNSDISARSCIHDLKVEKPARPKKKVAIWAIISGAVVLFVSLHAFSKRIGYSGSRARDAKYLAIKSGCTRAVINGIVFGWGEPPEL